MAYKIGDKVIVVGRGSSDIPTGTILDVVSQCSVAGQWICETDVQLSYLGTEGKNGLYKVELYSPRRLEDVVTRLKEITAELQNLQAEQDQLNATLRIAGLQLIA